MKRKYRQWRSSIPPLSTKRTITSLLRERPFNQCSYYSYKVTMIQTYQCNENLTVAISGAGTAYPSSPPFLVISCCSIFAFCVVFCRSLFVLFLLAITLSILPQFTDSDYPVGIFKFIVHLFFPIYFVIHLHLRTSRMGSRQSKYYQLVFVFGRRNVHMVWLGFLFFQ
jgi:hypothetical protein